MAEHTPTTEQVRSGYALRGWDGEPEIVGEKGWEAQARRDAEFDRWLAERDEKIRRDQIEKDAALADRQDYGTRVWAATPKADARARAIAAAIRAQAEATA